MFIRRFFCVGISTLLFAFSSIEVFAESCSQKGNELSGLVGLDHANGIYASFSSSQNQCGCTAARFYKDKVDTNKALSVLMAAKLSKNTVRIDFAEADNCNSASRVYLE